MEGLGFFVFFGGVGGELHTRDWMVTQRYKDTGVHKAQWKDQEASQIFTTPITISVSMLC